MPKPTWMAHAKPKEHVVHVRKKVYVYAHIQKKELSEDACFYRLMKQVAKVCLRMTKQFYKPKTET